MKWVSSAGGPLVLVPSISVADWHGCSNGNGSASDYDVACSTEGYARALRLRDTNVLVLNDEPLQTAFFHDDDRPFLVRWMYAPNQQHVDDALKGLREKLGPPVEVTEFRVDAPEMVLMDAAEEGSSPIHGERLVLNLKVATHRVLTYVNKPSIDVALLVHEFGQ
jgi:Immunity protein 21